ncbi:MAG TPA: hypothetical protein DEB30_05170 [Candidatus Peribacter riflensis]|uniref:Uncharacterized protein n=1 Tax=Candidatus Peribacter riflensis TaxID=1735162 RepID=A0A0S1SUQ0_9BACT|nr:MAG: hypothetical protein PeribacterA2_0978 [Candidatus Peribacter riflensis]OGJ78471.1 MAG: hypothetical protein A2398_02405 [Candidatus Peribacteria bacterium RIFOXYB1_FULL_57_12]OGJ80397.1 MAG: hypothetical protein A2412_00665 [Candidatus Peribacteria bacterium RIFOXYC1_FULL_58_8]ALM11440.1 MAG: hypothetical protein PeribacterB2_0980 [Candidatus Peribacter riflensis]ALM12542.1 MAG: hypothetical protein PeribacterC2_0979 [Candidatus Peribacter riflensis]
MNDGSSFNLRLSGVDLPDPTLLFEKEFQLLMKRNVPVADAVLSMSKGARMAVEALMNRAGHGWSQFLYVENPAVLKDAAESLHSSMPGSPARAEAEKTLRALTES